MQNTFKIPRSEVFSNQEYILERYYEGVGNAIWHLWIKILRPKPPPPKSELRVRYCFKYYWDVDYIESFILQDFRMRPFLKKKCSSSPLLKRRKSGSEIRHGLVYEATQLIQDRLVRRMRNSLMRWERNSIIWILVFSN